MKPKRYNIQGSLAETLASAGTEGTYVHPGTESRTWAINTGSLYYVRMMVRICKTWYPAIAWDAECGDRWVAIYYCYPYEVDSGFVAYALERIDSASRSIAACQELLCDCPETHRKHHEEQLVEGIEQKRRFEKELLTMN